MQVWEMEEQKEKMNVKFETSIFDCMFLSCHVRVSE